MRSYFFRRVVPEPQGSKAAKTRGSVCPCFKPGPCNKLKTSAQGVQATYKLIRNLKVRKKESRQAMKSQVVLGVLHFHNFG